MQIIKIFVSMTIILFPSYTIAQDISDEIPQIETILDNENSEAPILGTADNNRYIIVIDTSRPQQGSLQIQSIEPERIETVRSIANDILAQNLIGAQSLNNSDITAGIIDAFLFVGTKEEVDALAKDNRVLFIEPDVLVSKFQLPWGLDRIDQRELPLSGSYQTAATTRQLNVYVLDSGVRETHAEFEGRAKNVENFAGGVDTDCNGHGTHVAGIIAGRSTGVIPSALIHSIKVLDCEGRGSNLSVISGINFAVANFKRPGVINMSLGSGKNIAIDMAIKKVVARGIPVVVAAGNSNADACDYSPANVPEAITVAASNLSDQLASYSNFGSCVDIIAPGSRVLSLSHSNNISLIELSGTSMAAPHVSGVGILLSHNEIESTPDDIACLLLQGATNGQIKGLHSKTPDRFLFTGNVSNTCSEKFKAARLAINGYAYNVGNWRVGRHLRMVNDVNSDGKADIIGFFDDGVYASLSNGGSFSQPTKVLSSFSHDTGWRVGRHLRMMNDINGDGKADIIGFFDDGVYASLSNGGSFSQPRKWTSSFGRSFGGWRVDRHLRIMSDVNNDGKADIVGFGNDAVYTALSNAQ